MTQPDPALFHACGLFFDLDGTLLDSYPVHFQAYQCSLSRLGYHLDEAAFLATYSPNWYHTYEAIGLPRDLWETADIYWLEEARQRQPALFPEAMDALTQLANAYPLGIVTSGSRSRVRRDLEANGIQDLFKAVITGDDVRSPKPAPEGLERAMQALGVPPQEAVYIGDTRLDFETAQAAGVRFVGIPSQFASLSTDDPCLQVASLHELLRVFGLE